jgi:hypothetical protein
VNSLKLKGVIDKFTEFIGDFKCSLCGNLPRDPHHCGKCCVLFCKYCIADHVRTTSLVKCPNCCSGSSSGLKCKRNHDMTDFKASEAYARNHICDECGARLVGAEREHAMRCSPCDYDLCRNCTEKKGKGGFSPKKAILEQMSILLSKFNIYIKCKNHTDGCKFQVKLDDYSQLEEKLSKHELNCDMCKECLYKCDTCDNFYAPFGEVDLIKKHTHECNILDSSDDKMEIDNSDSSDKRDRLRLSFGSSRFSFGHRNRVLD